MNEEDMIHDIMSGFDETHEQAPSEDTAVPEAPLPRPLTHREPQTQKYHIEKEPPTAIVIHCGDSRFQNAFRQFIEEELNVHNYVPIVVLGGIHALGFRDLMPKHYKALFDQIRHLVKDRGIHRIIIINHEDCRWYERFSSWVVRRVPLPQKQRDDLHAAAESLFEHFLHIEVETYYAELDGDTIHFKRIS